MRWFVILVAAGLVGMLVYGVASERRDDSIDRAVAEARKIDAPVAALPRLGADGQASLAEYRGKVVLLNFWASWCKPCTDELPLLERTHRSLSDRGALVLGVNYKDVSDDALEFGRKFRLTFPSVRDRDGSYAERFGSRAFPESFLIDREGKVVAIRRGPVTQKWIDRTVEPLL